MKLQEVYELINAEIKNFNGAYDNDNGSDKQKEYTKQFEGFDHINTSKAFADKSWEFSKTIESILNAVNEVAKDFEEVPADAILKDSEEYAERIKNEAPKKAVVGFSDRMNYAGLLSIARDGVGRRDLKTVKYF